MRIKEINIFTPSEDRGYLGCFLTLSDCMAEYPCPRRGYQFANLETRSIWVYDGVAWWNSNRQLEPMRVIGSPAQSGDIVSNEPSAYYYVDNSGLEQTLEFVFNNTTTGLDESITVLSSGYAMVYIWWTGKTLEYKKIDLPSYAKMSGIVCGMIDMGTNDYSVLDDYNSQEKKGWYIIKRSLGFGGHLLVTGDEVGHVIHQFILSDYALDDSGTISGHKDGTPSVIVRTYNLRSSTIGETIPVGTWGRWQYLQDTFITQNIGQETSVVMSQKAVTDLLHYVINGTIDIGSFQYDVLDNYNTQEQKGWYVIKTSQGFGGHMLVTGDDMGHVIHQFIFSDYSLNSSGDIISHKDERPSVIFRTYHIVGGTSSIPVGTWGRWYDLSEFIRQEIPDASDQKSGLMSAEDKKKLDSLSLSSSIKTIRIAHFGIGATPQKMGEYSYNPQINKVTYSNPDIMSSEQFDPMPDTLYINDDEESDYPLGIYAMDAEGKLASITGFVMP